MITYSIKKSEVEGQEDLIEKVGGTSTFLASDVNKNLAAIAKAIKECHAKVELEKARQANIETFHPGILEIPEEERCAIALYESGRGSIKQFEEKMKELEEILAEYTEESQEIFKQTGIEIVVPVVEKVSMKPAESEAKPEEQA